MDRTGDDKYFRIREINTTTIQILLSKSLEDLVDSDVPQNILKFKIQCNTLVTNSNDVSGNFYISQIFNYQLVDFLYYRCLF